MWKYVTRRLNPRRALARSVAFLLGALALVLVSYLFERYQGLSVEDGRGMALYAEALKMVKEDYVNQKALSIPKSRPTAP